MKPYLNDGDITVYQGDCIEVMRQMPENSVDAIVTDPPYGLEFMGKDWDKFSPVDLDRGGRWTKDKRGTPGSLAESQPGNAHGRVAFGANRSYTSVCRTCGRRDAFRNEHACAGEPKWERVPVDEGAPPQLVAFQTWTESWACEAYRVLKPGGHLLAFAGTRTYHRMASGVEDAGFEIRDCIAWMYGSGFPKSLDVSKAIDKAAGAEREVTREVIAGIAPGHGNAVGGPKPIVQVRDNPASDTAREWSGWGTALKPAFEPVVVARKPLVGTVAQNVLEHGTGALNIDGCRIASPDGVPMFAQKGNASANGIYGDGLNGSKSLGERDYTTGRWPANITLDETAAAMLDEQSGYQKDGTTYLDNRTVDYNASSYKIVDNRGGTRGYGGGGGASRFFYTAKASRQDRNVGGLADNTHPTVKPTDLMRWLVRLVTPPGGVVLDPFGGSGSTGLACRAETVRCILIEREAEYLQIISDRLAQLSLFSTSDEDAA